MKIKLHKGQYEVAKAEERFKIVCAGRRWGKSVLARMMMLEWASKQEGGLYWIVCPTYQQGKDIHWNQGYKIEFPPNLVRKWNDSDLLVELVNGAVIQIKTSENPDRLKGVKLRGLIVDEIASMRNWGWIWKEALRPTLVDFKAPAMFISTPKGFNHFYELFLMGKSGTETFNKNFRSWHYTSYENPYIPKEEIDAAKAEYTNANGEILDYFYQEYMAEFRKFTGLVYKEFDIDTHVIKPFDIPKDWKIYRGLDFGHQNPTCCLWIAQDNDNNWFVVDEHFEAERTIDYHAGIINANEYSKRVTGTFGDPSGGQWFTEFATKGVYISKAVKERSTKFNRWVGYGIEKVKNMLTVKPGKVVSSLPGDGYPSLFVFNKCKNTIREFENYKWKEKIASKADINEPDIPEKAHDHTMDALRYVRVSTGKRDTEGIGVGFPEQKLFKKGGFY
jgi:hypothetical protein